MGKKIITKDYHVERRTYIKGTLYGKYYGWLDESDWRSHAPEKYYDIEVFEGTITQNNREQQIRTWDEGEDPEFLDVDLFHGKIPPEITLEIQEDSTVRARYKIHLHDPKIKNITLGSPNYDGELVYGEFRGEISGYVRHFDTVRIDEEIEVAEAIEKGGWGLEGPKGGGDNSKLRGCLTGLGDVFTGLFWLFAAILLVSFLLNFSWSDLWTLLAFIGVGLLLGIFYLIFSFILDKKGTNGRGDNPRPWGCLSNLGYIFTGLFWLIAAVLLVSFFLNFSWSDLWALLAFIGVVLLVGIFYLLFSYILRLIFALFALAFPFLVILGVVWLMDYIPTIDDQLNPKDSPEEVKSTEPLSENPQDSIISHYRIWKDYSGNTYKGRFKVKKSDYQQASIDRNNLDYVSMSIKGYNALITELYSQQDSQLYMLYAMYDSIRLAAKLDRIQFAEMVVSSIQDIPYVLVLDGPCDRSVDQGEFVEQYLEKGGACKGNIKFGIYAPSEFLGHLNGDCDTRTVMLFTILTHFKYDVVILSSDRFGHSILGINLPMEGVSKQIDGKSYLMWETTSRGNPPGVVPRQFANGRYWDVNIKSTNYLK